MRRGRLASAVPGGWREQFDRDGFVEVREFLPADDFKRLRSSILSGAFDARQHQQGVTITRRIPIGPRSPRESAATSRVLRDKKWNGLLSYIASTRSGPLCYAQMILIGHACGPSDPQLELQRGSLRISPEELDSLALPQPKRFAVPANTLVAIDTGGIPRTRKLDASHGSSRDMGSSRTCSHGIRSQCAAQAELTRIVDRLEPLGLAKQHWKPSPRSRPTNS